MDKDTYYTPDEAAKVLKMTSRRIRQLAESGEIEGKRSGNRWEISKASVHNFREIKPPKKKASDAAVWPVQAREALEEVKDLRYQLGRMEGRLELTEQAESTLREALERERERVDQERQERERLLEELKRERERADKLEEAQEESRLLREDVGCRAEQGVLEEVVRVIEAIRPPWWRK
jgi:excisionase family DNA binding protein